MAGALEGCMIYLPCYITLGKNGSQQCVQLTVGAVRLGSAFVALGLFHIDGESRPSPTAANAGRWVAVLSVQTGIWHTLVAIGRLRKSMGDIMKTNNVKVLRWVLMISMLLSGCGPGQFLGPTITPSPTSTLTPTITPSPTPTQTSTPTITVTPTPVCSITNGDWVSEEFVFGVSDCKITYITLIFGTIGAPFYEPLASDEIVIVDKKFDFSKSDADGTGEYTFSGEFDSDVHAHGKLTVT